MALKRIVFLLLLGGIGAFFVRRFVVEGIFIATPSMEPTLPVGLHVLVNKLAYIGHPPRRGDIILFARAEEPGKGLVKRVIAIPGDEIEIRKKEVFLNGQPLSEPYVQHVSPNTLFVGDDTPAETVPAQTVFVMGDNRDVSGDSRDWRAKDGEWKPFLQTSQIEGRLVLPDGRK